MIRGGKIIRIGLNKNKSGCLGDPLYELKGWHSELDVLHDLDTSLIKGSILYVAGISRGGNTITSCPCRWCQQYLKKFPLKAVYYTLPNDTYGQMTV